MTGIRARRRAENEARILVAARELLAEHEFDALGVRDIAQRAGVAAGTLIFNFTSKEDLLLAVAGQVLAEVAEESVSCLRADRPILRAVLDASSVIGRLARDQRGLFRALMMQGWRRGPEAEEKLQQTMSPMMQALQDRFRAEKAAGRADAKLSSSVAAELVLEAMLAGHRLEEPTAAMACASLGGDDRRIRRLTQLVRALAPGSAPAADA